MRLSRIPSQEPGCGCVRRTAGPASAQTARTSAGRPSLVRSRLVAEPERGRRARPCREVGLVLYVLACMCELWKAHKEDEGRSSHGNPRRDTEGALNPPAGGSSSHGPQGWVARASVRPLANHCPCAGPIHGCSAFGVPPVPPGAHPSTSTAQGAQAPWPSGSGPLAVRQGVFSLRSRRLLRRSRLNPLSPDPGSLSHAQLQL